MSDLKPCPFCGNLTRRALSPPARMVPRWFVDFIMNQQNLPGDFRKVLNDHYWELLDSKPVAPDRRTK